MTTGALGSFINSGRVGGLIGGGGDEIARPGSAATWTGAWRPDLPFNGRDGLKVTLKRERGVTPQDFLLVPFRFQVGPTDSWARSREFEFPTYDTISAGEQPQVGGPRLERPSFSTMFLDEEYQWMVWNGSLDVQRMLRELYAIQDRAVPFRLTITQAALWGSRPLLSTVAVFTAIRAEQRGGEVGIEYADVEFMEWPRQRLEQRGGKGKRRPSAREQQRRERIRSGDTLYEMARRLYHRKSAWRALARANGIENVSPDDAGELDRWADRHNRRTLKVPPLSPPGVAVMEG